MFEEMERDSSESQKSEDREKFLRRIRTDFESSANRRTEEEFSQG
jgi:hypothetical protein